MGLFGGDRPYANTSTESLVWQINVIQQSLDSTRYLEQQYDEALRIGVDTSTIEFFGEMLLDTDYEKVKEDKKKLRQMKREFRRRKRRSRQF
jgi:hypothetical protein